MKYIILVLIFLTVGCSKKEDKIPELPIEDLVLSNIIYGIWEARESVSFRIYLDTLWHKLDTPYLITTYEKPDIYQIKFNNQVLETTTFEISDENQTISYFEPNNTTWDVESFSEDSLVLASSSREGPIKSKFFKIE